MEIKSVPPPPKTLRVTDIDVRFAGETAQFTLRPGDEMHEDSVCLFIDFANDEKISVMKANVLWVSVRERDMTLPPEKTDEPPHRQSSV